MNGPPGTTPACGLVFSWAAAAVQNYLSDTGVLEMTVTLVVIVCGPDFRGLTPVISAWRGGRGDHAHAGWR